MHHIINFLILDSRNQENQKLYLNKKQLSYSDMKKRKKCSIEMYKRVRFKLIRRDQSIRITQVDRYKYWNQLCRNKRKLQMISCFTICFIFIIIKLILSISVFTNPLFYYFFKSRIQQGWLNCFVLIIFRFNSQYLVVLRTSLFSFLNNVY